jgi:hypothetical protein
MMIDAILDLRDQLARVEIVEGPPEGEGMEARQPAVAGDGQGRREPLSSPRKRPQQKAVKNMTRARL